MGPCCQHCERPIRLTREGIYLHNNGLNKCLPEEQLTTVPGATGDAARTRAEP